MELKMDDKLIRVLLVGVILLVTPNAIRVNGDFVLTVDFINYTNPTGLCAECETELESGTSVDQLIPVCCDESPITSVNCDNTGEARCDTRFRWTIRPFGALLETRPATEPGAVTPPYYFTDCNQSPTTCPFSEMSTTFSQGSTGFLGVAANPLPVVPKTDSIPWTGSVQFFIEAVESTVPNIIDSLLINLDNLQLGADFTEEMTFTGYHNISHMTMSFRVACKTGFCGRDCTATRMNNPRIFSCNIDGEIVCTDSRYNLTAECNECLHNLDISTECSTCLEPSFDPDTNCTACLPGYNSNTNCTACLPGYNIDTNCLTCFNTNYDPSTNCTTCLLGPQYDPGSNCTMCLDSRFDPNSDCTSCLLGGYDPQTNCTQCLPNRDLSTNCTQCSPGWDISSDCTSCLPHRDPSTNCTHCLPNRDLSTDCSTCLFGFDMSRDCSVCLPGRDISTNCTTCLSGYTGENCVPVSGGSSMLSAEVVGGIAGGVGGALLLVIIVLVVIVCMLVCQVRRSGHAKLNISDGGAVSNAYNLNNGGTGTGSSVEHNFHNPIYGPGQELDSKIGTRTSPDRMLTNSLYEPSKIQKGDNYSQLRHPSTSPPAHQVKTGTNDFTSPSGGPVYDSANYQDGSHPKEGTPVYDTADHSLSNNPPFSREISTQQSYSRLRHPTETSITLQPVPPIPLEAYDTTVFTEQPVYDKADLPPSTVSALEKKTRHPSKSGAAYEEVDDDAIVPSGTASSGVYGKAYHTPSPSNREPSANAYSQIGGPTNIYSAVEEPSDDYSALEGPTEDYSELKHPAKAITKTDVSKFNRSGSNYSRLNGHTAVEVTTYDTADNHHHPQIQPQTLPPHQAALYDTANYPNEPSEQHKDYTETADFTGLPTDSSPPSSVKPHPYDYIDTHLDGEKGSSLVPPAVDPQVKTTPGAHP